MKHNKKRISSIIDELTTYFLTIGCSEIDINLKDQKDYYKIFFKCDYPSYSKDKIDKLVNSLKCDKQAEMEEYYWQLAGSSDINTELILIGMMIDDADISIIGNTIKITLFRYK